MNNEILKELLIITKKYGPGVGLAILATVLSACGAKPQITTSIENCGGEAEVDVAPGVLQKITVPGLDLQYIINEDGSLTYFSKPKFTDNPPSTRQIGDLNGEHLIVELQGDTDGDGRQNVVFQSVCPIAPTPTITPQPSETPTGLLKGIVRSTSLVKQGFHPGQASKPVFTSPLRKTSLYRL